MGRAENSLTKAGGINTLTQPTLNSEYRAVAQANNVMCKYKKSETLPNPHNGKLYRHTRNGTLHKQGHTRSPNVHKVHADSLERSVSAELGNGLSAG